MYYNVFIIYSYIYIVYSLKFDLHRAAPLHLQGNPCPCTGRGTACLLGTFVPIICWASHRKPLPRKAEDSRSMATGVISWQFHRHKLLEDWRIVEDCNEQQFHGLPISLEQQCAATTLTDFVDATSRIGRPVWQALDYRLDHGGAEGTKMDQIRKDPDPSWP